MYPTLNKVSKKKNEIAEVIINDREIQKKKLRQEIENELRKLDIDHCLQLQIQGNFIAMEDIDKKIYTPNLLWLEIVR